MVYSEVVDIAILSVASFVATCVQGVAGMGFGMVTVPFFVVIIGAHYGILWSNICGGVVAFVLILARFRDIEWSRLKLLLAGAIPALLGTVFALRFVPDRVFSVFVGVIMLAMVAFSLLAPRFKPLPLFPASLSFGFLAGAMSALVAQAGPTMAAYAQTTRWGQKEFAATLQPLFLCFNIFVVGGKLWFGGQGGAASALPPFAILVLSLAIVLGVLASRFLIRIVKPLWARNLALTLATLGALRVIWGVIFS